MRGIVSNQFVGSCSRVIKMNHKKSPINILRLFVFNTLLAVVIWVQLNKKDIKQGTTARP